MVKVLTFFKIHLYLNRQYFSIFCLYICVIISDILDQIISVIPESGSAAAELFNLCLRAQNLPKDGMLHECMTCIVFIIIISEESSFLSLIDQ